MEKYTDLIDREAKALTARVLDTYDTGGRKYTMEYYQTYRRNAIADGIQVMIRNFFKMVVDKSGMLWNSKAPVLEIWEPEAQDADDIQSQVALGIFEKAQWVEFFTNLDPIVRALKTVHVLVQFDQERQRWAFDMLHQENSAIKVDAYGDIETAMVYVGKHEFGSLWRVWDRDTIKEVVVNAEGKEELISVEPHPYGVVPVCAFHDTNVPRHGAWNTIPYDLLDANHAVNCAYTDSSFTMKWMKNPTLYTDAEMQVPTDVHGNPQITTEERQYFGQALPRTVRSSGTGELAGGPGRIIGISSTNDAGSVFAEFLAPSAPLKELDDVVHNWMINYAADWAVNARTAGTGVADSGFKLVVEEMPNLELRKKRQRMQEAGMKRLWEIIKNIARINGYPLSETSELYARFPAPDLPVDERSTEEVWDRRIQQGRATRVDYFMAVQGMSKKEAEQKVAEIDAAPRVSVNRPAPTAVTTTSVSV